MGGESSRYSLSANWLGRASPASTFRVAAYAIDYDMSLYSNFTYATTPQGDQFQQVDRRRLYGWDAQWRHEGSLGGRPMANTLGSQFRYDDIAEVALRNTRRRQVTGIVRTDAVDEWSNSLYWRNEVEWTPRLRSVAGLRYDYYDFRVNALAAGDPDTLAPNSGDADDDILTASLNLSYAFNASVEAYAGIGQGFHSNDARGVTIRRDPLTGEGVTPVDPLVKTLGMEVGMRAFLTDRLNASAALWRLDIDSELLFVGDAGNTEDTGVGSERHGLEITAYYQLSRIWALDVEYAWARSRFSTPVDGSDAIPGALDTVFSGGLSMRLNDRFRAYLRLRHFGDYPLDGGAAAPASTIASLRLGYDVSERLSIKLDLLNLFDSDDHDVEYFYASRLPGESQPVADRHYHVFEPRSLRAYVDYRFP